MSISKNPYDDDRYEINYAEATAAEAADKTLKPVRDDLANKAISRMKSGSPVLAARGAAVAYELNERLADPDHIYKGDARTLFDDNGYVDLANHIITEHADAMADSAERIYIDDGGKTIRQTIDELRARVNRGDDE